MPGKIPRVGAEGGLRGEGERAAVEVGEFEVRAAGEDGFGDVRAASRNGWTLHRCSMRWVHGSQLQHPRAHASFRCLGGGDGGFGESAVSVYG